MEDADRFAIYTHKRKDGTEIKFTYKKSTCEVTGVTWPDRSYKHIWDCSDLIKEEARQFQHARNLSNRLGIL